MKKVLFFSTAVLSLSFLGTLLTPSTTHAFDAGNIISDSAFTDHNSMSVNHIQNFLNSKVPVCDTNGDKPHGGVTRREYAASRDVYPPFTCLKDYNQGGKSAAQIIYDAAQEFRINPKVLIVLLQKEQGLITDDWPWPIQYRSATGYGCPDSAPCDSEYYGLTNQIRWAARMFRSIIDNSPTWYTPYVLGNNQIPWHPDTGRCGYSTVNIQNRATQALYNYTPYRPNQAALNAGYGLGDSCSSYGNRNFYLYYKDWFGAPAPDPIRIIECSGQKYLVERDIPQKRYITDKALAAWGNFSSLTTSSNDPGCGYPTYGLQLERIIRSRSSGSVYIVDRGSAYLIKNQTVADAWGIGNLQTSSFPQLNGDSINYLNVQKDLPRVAVSSNPNVSNVYLLDNKKCYIIQGEASVRLVRGYNDVSRGVFSPSLLLDHFMSEGGSSSCGALDYSFKVGDNWYFLNHGKILKISSNDTGRWSAHLNGPTLSSQVFSLFGQRTLGHGWKRDSNYYAINAAGQLEHSTNFDIGAAWGATYGPAVTQLLTNKIISATEGGIITRTGVSANGFRLFTCDGQAHLVERSIPTKRLITSEGLQAWKLNETHIPPADGTRSCNYPSYPTPLGTTLRSRSTGRVYIVDNGTAHYVHSAQAATAWNVNLDASHPQFNSDSIHHLTINRELPQLARSAATNRVYLIDGGKRHYVTDSEVNGTSSLRLIRGYDTVPMIDASSSLLLQQLSSSTTDIDYAFSINDEWYLLDHNQPRKIDSEKLPHWQGFISGPELSADILEIFDQKGTVGDNWQRDQHFYRVNSNGELQRTEDNATAEGWGASSTSPTLTHLLTNRLVELLGLTP